MSNKLPIQISFTNRFERDVRRLAKRYRSIKLDIQVLIQKLELGDLPGDQIPNLQQTVFKVRVKNSDIQKGKSGGYRVIYYLKTETQIILITLYSKSDRSDMSLTEIQKILNPA
ncbi:type II toxin-antitoxin system RelE/ParE family toxin [Oscillatoria sp. CS-180]|uniref:type II toxin-antitoxin system RelE family toxin n=1 Tax=Oscillatoria sp. CS-180 TaxID=3021720 RepID=UPI00232F5DF9|nr:type II toxin-antitoxin system RelE/ParE family toxin [Oscillatoria sp. CS-180]MDB9528148.1 type II toxin-antitoxin system RelE/ParE family toxin [Oscillatoria sp. CS-180]